MFVHQEAIQLVAADGTRLEARFARPERPRGGIVVCHPHPLFEGSMSTPPVPDLVRAAASAGWAAIRFNFRGTHRSEGRHDGGRAEQHDVRAALDHLATALEPHAPLAVIGCSFGSLVALAAVAGDPRVTTYVAVAPPVGGEAVTLREPIGPAPERLAGWRVRALAVVGSQDRFAPRPAVEAWRDATLGDRMRIEVIDGAPHLFDGFRHELVEMVTGFVTT